MAPKVNINILTWNAEKYLRPCLDSAAAQDYSNYEILIIDNASKDRTLEIIKKYLRSKNPKIRLIKNKENIGFAAGHNQGIRETDGKYVMLLNQDAILTSDFLKKAVKILEKDSKIAALQPKVLRYDFQKQRPKNTFDTTGLIVLRNRRIINRGQGEKDKGQYDKQEEIFGADGAVPIYRRKALEDTKLPTFKKEPKFEYFDQTFFAYKEDVDLAWRLRLYGWKTIYSPEVIAYHQRGAGESAARSSWEIIKERRKISLFAKALSWKNQRLMQIKNEIPSSFLKDLPWILSKEIKSWGYVVLFEPKILRCLPQLFRLLPVAFRKRRVIMANKKIDGKEVNKWFAK